MKDKVRKLVEEAKGDVQREISDMAQLSVQKCTIGKLAEYLENSKELELTKKQVEAFETVIIIIGQKKR